jgi:hypothetical protein
LGSACADDRARRSRMERTPRHRQRALLPWPNSRRKCEQSSGGTRRRHNTTILGSCKPTGRGTRGERRGVRGERTAGRPSHRGTHAVGPSIPNASGVGERLTGRVAPGRGLIPQSLDQRACRGGASRASPTRRPEAGSRGRPCGVSVSGFRSGTGTHCAHCPRQNPTALQRNGSLSPSPVRLRNGDWHPSGPSVPDESKPAATGWVPVPESGSDLHWGQRPASMQTESSPAMRMAKQVAVPRAVPGPPMLPRASARGSSP